MSLFVHKQFTSHSGLLLPDKIDCDALTKDDWNSVAAWFAKRLKFGKVVGIPRGGLALAEALEPYKSFGPVLICDDVLTTGKSMKTMEMKYPGAIGAVLFSRAKYFPHWITARFIESA